MNTLVLANDVARFRLRSQQVIASLPVIPQDLPEMPESISEGPRQFEQNIRSILRYLKKVLKALTRAGAHESLDKLEAWRRAVRNWHDVVQESPEAFVNYERTGRLPSPNVEFTPSSSLTGQQNTLPAPSVTSPAHSHTSDERWTSTTTEVETELDTSASSSSYEFTFPENGAAPSQVFVFSSAEASSQEDEHAAVYSGTGSQEVLPSNASGPGQEEARADMSIVPQEPVAEEGDDIDIAAGNEAGVVVTESAPVETDVQESVTIEQPQHELESSTSSTPFGFSLPQNGTGLSHVFVWMGSHESPQEDELSDAYSDTGAPEVEPATAKESVDIEEPKHELDASTASSSVGFTLPQTGTGLAHVFIWMGSQESSQDENPVVSAEAVVVKEPVGVEEPASIEQLVVFEEPVDVQKPVSIKDSVVVEPETYSPHEDAIDGAADEPDLQGSNRHDEVAEGPEEDSVCDKACAGDDLTLLESLTPEPKKVAEGTLAKDSGRTTVPIHFRKMSPTSILIGATAGALMVASFPVVSACMLYAGITYAKYSLNH